MEMTTLDAAAILPERPFSHPNHTLADLRVLDRCLSRLRAALHTPLLRPEGDLLLYEWQDDAGLGQRIILRQGVELRSYLDVAVVGFFGQRRTAAAPGPIQDLDHELMLALADYEEVLCYFTSQLESGDYGNLVLFADEAAKTRWNQHPRHALAAREVAPAYYHSVRLHNGYLGGGILCCDGPILTSTKYYDYDLPAEAAGPWRAIRRWSPPVRLPS